MWDEIVPQHWYAIEALDCMLRDSDKPFGGVMLLMGGDFQQTLLVIPKGTWVQVLDATVMWSYLWNNIEVIHLHENMQLQDDPKAEKFREWLLQIRHGKNSDENSKVEIPQDIHCSDIESLMTFIYSNLDSASLPPPKYFLNWMILAPQNSNVSSINETLLDRMNGDVKTYYSTDQIIWESGANGHSHLLITPEFLCSVKSTSLPPRELRIKIGCPLNLIWNLSPLISLCNGSHMIVVRMSEQVLQVRLIRRDHDGQFTLIPQISLILILTPNYTFKIWWWQFPVQLAFTVTINQSQGQSVKYVGLESCILVFAHSQLYIALSQVTTK